MIEESKKETERKAEIDTETDTERAVPPEDIQVGICPYFVRDRGKGLVYCECARFRFPDPAARREIVYRFCAHPTGYKTCMLKQCLDNHYERKYAYETCSE